MLSWILYIFGALEIIGGIILAFELPKPFGLYSFVGAIISAIFVFALAVIIDLLTEIRDSLVTAKASSVDDNGKNTNMLLFACPSCKKQMQYPSYRSKQKVKCKGCQEEIVLP